MVGKLDYTHDGTIDTGTYFLLCITGVPARSNDDTPGLQLCGLGTFECKYSGTPETNLPLFSAYRRINEDSRMLAGRSEPAKPDRWIK